MQPTAEWAVCLLFTPACACPVYVNGCVIVCVFRHGSMDRDYFWYGAEMLILPQIVLVLKWNILVSFLLKHIACLSRKRPLLRGLSQQTQDFRGPQWWVFCLCILHTRYLLSLNSIKGFVRVSRTSCSPLLCNAGHTYNSPIYLYMAILELNYSNFCLCQKGQRLSERW